MNKPFIDHYAILCVDQKASNADIKKSYRHLIRVHHPDKNPKQTKQQLDYCKAIMKAYEVLSNPWQRIMYDRDYQRRKLDSQSSHRGNSSSRQNENREQEKTDREDKNQQKSSYHKSQESSKDQREKAKPKNDRGSTSNNHNQSSSSSNQGRYENDHSRRQEDRSNNDRKHNNSDRSHYQNRDYSHYQENSRSQDRNRNHSEDRYPNFDFHNTYQNGRSCEANSNLYEILGLRKNASKSDIKRAYIKLTEKISPDSGNPEIRRQSAEILKAYVILSDPQLRASYDREDNNSNQNSSTYGTFAFLDDVHFDDSDSDIWTFLKGISLGCLGCGLVFYVISKWTVQLICIIVPQLAKVLIILLIIIAKGIGLSFQMLFRCCCSA